MHALYLSERDSASDTYPTGYGYVRRTRGYALTSVYERLIWNDMFAS